jgi:xylan 1,4-beta-xylosidase
MVWNYHDEDLPAPASPVSVSIKNIPAKKALLTHYRIDDQHSNSYEVWKKMGSPQQPSQAQIKELEKAGQLAMLETPKTVRIKNGLAVIQLQLPRQGVSLLQITWR